jgi:hypothetical protein
MMDAIHGIVESPDALRFVHRNLLDATDFAGYLRQRPPYVSLERSLLGEGDSLSIDDSTVAAADAARLVRRLGHDVTIFLNGWNIVEGTPYCFSGFNAVLDETRVNQVTSEGTLHDLRTARGKQSFRRSVKLQWMAIASESDREELIAGIGRMLGIDSIVVPPHLSPLTPEQVRELIDIGVDVQNHGWIHVRMSAISADAQAENILLGREWLRSEYGVESSFVATPYGGDIPPWNTSPHYKAWFLLDSTLTIEQHPADVFSRATLELAS